MSDPQRQDAGVLSYFVTYSRRLQDKLQRFAKIAGRSILPPPQGTAAPDIPDDPELKVV